MDNLLKSLNDRQFGTILIDPPWRFANRTGKMAPEHKHIIEKRDMALATPSSKQP
ncbi:MAG: hypothetical protein ACRD2P_02365 [Terriglobia bacterium]